MESSPGNPSSKPQMKPFTWNVFLKFYLRLNSKNNSASVLYVSDYQLKCNHFARITVLSRNSLLALRHFLYRFEFAEQKVFGVGNFEFHYNNENGPKFLDSTACQLIRLIRPRNFVLSGVFKDPNPQQIHEVVQSCGLGCVELVLDEQTNTSNALQLLHALGPRLQTLRCDPKLLAKLDRLPSMCLSTYRPIHKNGQKKIQLTAIANHRVRCLDLVETHITDIDLTTIKEPVESIQELRLKARVSEAGNVVQILEQIHSKFPQLKHLNVQFEENFSCRFFSFELSQTISRLFEFARSCQSSIQWLTIQFYAEQLVSKVKNPECNWTKKFLETADFSKVWNHIEENKANETLKLEYWDNFLAFQVYAQLSTISNAYDFDYIDAATNRSYFY